MRCGDIKCGQEYSDRLEQCPGHETWAPLSSTLLALVHRDRPVAYRPTCCSWCKAFRFCSILEIVLWGIEGC